MQGAKPEQDAQAGVIEVVKDSGKGDERIIINDNDSKWERITSRAVVQAVLESH